MIVPTVRIDEHFEDAMQSLLSQRYGSIEIIVVLDGVAVEPDDRWGSDPRVRIEKLEYRVGTPRALNHGASLAAGKYIARLDADDVAKPGRIAAQVAVLEASPNLVCIGSSVELIGGQGESLGRLEAVVGPTNVTSGLLRRNMLIHSSVMYRTDAFRSIGGYNTTCARMQDYDLFLRLAAIGELDNSPAILTSYRIHPGQHSRNTSPWKRYTREILRARSVLSRVQGRSPLRQSARNGFWFLAQVARHHRLTMPGYIRRMKHAPDATGIVATGQPFADRIDGGTT